MRIQAYMIVPLLMSCGLVPSRKPLEDKAVPAIPEGPSDTSTAPVVEPDGKGEVGHSDSETKLIWSQANLTNFTSYPDPGSEECLKYNGCKWAGMFAALPDKQTESWVQSHNIVAVHSKDFETYKLKTLRLKKDSKEIDVKVYDMCSDSDCDGCCTKNSKATKFLIDIESYSAQRFGVSDGIVQWTCLDCPSKPVMEPSSKEKVLGYLSKISGQKILAGIENKNAATPASDSEKIAAMTGKVPSFWGGDFGFGYDAIKNRPKLIEEAKRQYGKGALVSLMYHACAPTRDEYCDWDQVGGKNPEKLSETQFKELLTPGTPLHQTWVARLDQLALYFQDLSAAGVTVIFRPFHEMNQCVFWWSCHKGPYGSAQLYRMTHDYLTKNKGLTQIIWAWNVQDFESLEDDVKTYSPGPEYFDLATLDIYNTGYTDKNYQTMLRVAEGKPIAVAECQFMPGKDILAQQKKWVYVMLWPDFIDQNKTTLGPLFQAEQVLTLDEMPGWNQPGL